MTKNQSNGFDKDKFDDNEKTAANSQPPFEAHNRLVISPCRLFMDLSIYAPPRKVITIPSIPVRRSFRMVGVPLTQTLISLVSQQLMN